MDFHRVTGLKQTGHPFHRCRSNLGAGRDDHGLFQGGLGSKRHNRCRREWAQVVGPDELNQLVDDLRKFIVQLLPQKGGQKSHPLQKAIDIGVGGSAAQHGGKRWVGF